MFKAFYPYEHVTSVHEIDYQKLYELGIKGIIFDIDNTLVHHGENSNPKTDQLFKDIHQLGLKTILLSNNCDERIEQFVENINTPYIADANKPKTENYHQAIRRLGFNTKDVVMVGDQLFTDIYGANKCKMPSILVDYMRHDDEVKIGIRRQLEKVILKCYRQNKQYQKRLGDIQLTLTQN